MIDKAIELVIDMNMTKKIDGYHVSIAYTSNSFSKSVTIFSLLREG